MNTLVTLCSQKEIEIKLWFLDFYGYEKLILFIMSKKFLSYIPRGLKQQIVGTEDSMPNSITTWIL